MDERGDLLLHMFVVPAECAAEIEPGEDLAGVESIHDGLCLQLVLESDGDTVALSYDGGVADGREECAVMLHKEQVSCVAFTYLEVGRLS